MTFVWWSVVYLRPNYHSDKAFRSCLVYANHRKYINHELFYAISVNGQWVDMSVSGNYWHLVRECTSCLSCTNISMYIIPMSTSVLVWYLFCRKSEYKKHVIWEIYNLDFFSTTMQCWCTNLSDFKWNSNITCEKYLLKVWKYAVLVDNGDIKIWPHAVYTCRLTFSYFFDICFLFSPMIYKRTIDHCITSVSITYLLQTLHPAQITVLVTCGQVQSVWRSMWPHGTAREGEVWSVTEGGLWY